MNVPISPQKKTELESAMERLGIRESDLEERFIRSGGPGGQNVNKVATCVVLKHVPSGITVKCQKDRTQAMNRFYARRILVQKMDSMILGRQSEEARRIAKIKRQKRRRSKRAKDKILQAKFKQGEKKKLRRRVFGED